MATPETKITALTNGPLLVEGPCHLVDQNGVPYRHGGKFKLCRCGGSATKPFCDGTHRRIGFVSPPQSTSADPSRDGSEALARWENEGGRSVSTWGDACSP
jgi:CDGSH-type Zn-finger protein